MTPAAAAAELVQRSFSIPDWQQRAEVVSSSIDVEKRTVDILFTTGARVLTWNWEIGIFEEDLDLDEKSVRTDRVTNGVCPLVVDHERNVRSQVGIVEKVWKTGKGWMARCRLSKRTDDLVPMVWQDLVDGILRGASFAYRVHKYQDLTLPNDKRRKLRAVDWEITEVTLTPVGADPKAGVRSEGQDQLHIVTIEERSMEPTAVVPTPAPAPAGQRNEPAPTPTPAPAAAPATPSPESIRAAEQSRILAIGERVRQHGLPDTLAQELIRSNATVEATNQRVLDELAKRSAGTPGLGSSGISVVREEGDKLLEGVRNRLEQKCQLRSEKVDNGVVVYGAPVGVNEMGRRFVGYGLIEMARKLLEARGVNTEGLSKMEIAQRALASTSDFPKLLANVGNKRLRQAYATNPQTWREFASTRKASDFKDLYSLQFSGVPRLLEVNEHGEYTWVALGEKQEKFRVRNYGVVTGFTREAMVNDDLSAFDRVPALFGRAANETESDLAYALITGNVTLADGVALYHNTHANLGDKVLSVAGLDQMRTKMRLQVGLKGERINVSLAHLRVPAALEATMEALVSATIVATKVADANVFRGTLKTAMAEPRLDAVSSIAWYGFADPGQVETMEYAVLDGEEAVTMETQEGFEIDGMKIRVRHSCGFGIVEHVGTAKSTGTV